jgi:hypothetical protein
MHRETSIRYGRVFVRMGKSPSAAAPQRVFASVHRHFRDRQELPFSKHFPESSGFRSGVGIVSCG